MTARAMRLAHGLNIIAGHVQEEAAACLVGDVRFEEPMFEPDRKPIAAFIRLGFRKDLPMMRHIPFELINKV